MIETIMQLNTVVWVCPYVCHKAPSLEAKQPTSSVGAIIWGYSTQKLIHAKSMRFPYALIDIKHKKYFDNTPSMLYFWAS